jgi:hypothetical protein
VAFDGSRAVVGAVGFDALSFDAETWLGAAWVLRRTGSGSGAAWAEEGRLIPEEPAEELRGDRYSVSVAIDGGWAVVGAPYDDEGGAAHVFQREGNGNWVPTQKLVNTLPLDFGYGWSLAMRDGALLTGGTGGSGESVAMWVRGEMGWTEQATLRPSDGNPFNPFGFG